MEQRAGGGTNHFRIEYVHAIAHQNDGVTTSGVGTADHGACIAGVAHLPECGKERMGSLRNPSKQVTAGIQVGNRKHPLGIMGNPVLHLLRHLVHMDPLLHRLTGKLAQRGRGDRGIRIRPIGAHIDILNDLWLTM